MPTQDMIWPLGNGAESPPLFIRPTKEGCRENKMSEERPSGSEIRHTPETVERLLSTVREALQMDVAFVSEFAADQFVFRALEGDAESFGWRVGEGFPLNESYCKRVLDGDLPSVIPDTRSEGRTRDLWVTSEANIGSYVAVPVMLSDGRAYGTLCCVSHRADPRLRERDLGLMEGVAREVSRQLKREGLQQ